MIKIIFLFLSFLNYANAMQTDYENLYVNPEEVKKILSLQPDENYQGKIDAPITIIEYSSLSCFHCAYFHKEIFPKIKSEFIDTDKVRFIHRDFPLDQVALRGAMLINCASSDKYFLFLKILFEKQENWAFQNNYKEILQNIGKLGGMSAEKLNQCFNDKVLEDKILTEKIQGDKIILKDNKRAILGTPTFFINGEKLNQDFQQMRNVINSKLAAR